MEFKYGVCDLPAFHVIMVNIKGNIFARKTSEFEISEQRSFLIYCF